MAAKIILNPYAGRWNARKRLPEVKEALAVAGIVYELIETTKPGHGIQLAEEAVRDGFNPIISAGGDGSMSEVINGVINSHLENNSRSKTSVGLLPLGSANDIAVNLGLPLDLNRAATIIAQGNTEAIDIGKVTYLDPDGETRHRYFDNNSALGLEPTITLIQQGMTRLRGAPRYILAALRGIMRNPQWTMHLSWDGGEYAGPVTVVTVGISPLTGGVFYMTPHADPFDGKLTFVHGSMTTRVKILRLLPRIMKPGAGSYVEHPDIHEIHTTWLKIHSDQPSPLHADGEIQSQVARDIEYTILPGYLPFLMNARKSDPTP